MDNQDSSSVNISQDGAEGMRNLNCCYEEIGIFRVESVTLSYNCFDIGLSMEPMLNSREVRDRFLRNLLHDFPTLCSSKLPRIQIVRSATT